MGNVIWKKKILCNEHLLYSFLLFPFLGFFSRETGWKNDMARFIKNVKRKRKKEYFLKIKHFKRILNYRGTSLNMILHFK